MSNVASQSDFLSHETDFEVDNTAILFWGILKRIEALNSECFIWHKIGRDKC